MRLGRHWGQSGGQTAAQLGAYWDCAGGVLGWDGVYWDEMEVYWDEVEVDWGEMGVYWDEMGWTGMRWGCTGVRWGVMG